MNSRQTNNGSRRQRSPHQRIRIEVGKRIRKLREKKGLSQVQLSRICGFWRGYIGDVERGNENLRLANLLKITRQLDTTIAQMFRGIV